VIFVPLAYFLGISLDLGLIGAWSALPFYVVVYSSIVFFKFKYGKESKVVQV
jgi:Na+-driven multidrug efflux pump